MKKFSNFIKYGTKAIILCVKFICLLPFVFFEIIVMLFGGHPAPSLTIMLINIMDEAEQTIEEIHRKEEFNKK